MTRLMIVAMAVLACGTGQAQTVSAVSSQTCNVALTQCLLVDAAGNSIVVQGQAVYAGHVNVSVVTPSGAVPSKVCTASRTVLSQTLYRVVSDLRLACGDGSALDGTYTASRSGSGRGGWAWHYHVAFDSVTLY